MRRLGEDKPDLILMDVVMPGPERLPADARDHARPALRRRAGDHVHQQEPGDRQGLGHAPGRARLHRQAGRRRRADGQDQGPGLTPTHAAHADPWPTAKPCANSRAGWPTGCRPRAPRACRPSWLAVECGGRGYLFPLRAGRRDLPVRAAAQPVPLQPGLVPGRGQPARRPVRRGRPGRLRRGRAPASAPMPTRAESRLVALNPSLDSQLRAADRPPGRPAQRRRASTPRRRRRRARPASSAAATPMPTARVWQEINLQALVATTPVPEHQRLRLPEGPHHVRRRPTARTMASPNKIDGDVASGDRACAERRRLAVDDLDPRDGRARPPRPMRRRRAGDGAAQPIARSSRGRAVRERRLHRDPLPAPTTGAEPLGAAAADRRSADRHAAAHPARAARPSAWSACSADDLRSRAARPTARAAGGGHRPGADAVAAARQVGVAGAGRQRRRPSPK